jgi:glycosyltransferase involved in cell wall biosynthesis
VVLDSLSTDRTVDIARAAGCRVVQRKFDNWSSHQNWAVQNISFKHPWVYYSDADEIVDPDLAREVLSVTSDPNNPNVAYRVRFKNIFFGRWLRFSSLYPTWVLRLFRPARVRWERLVNPVPTIDGPEGKLTGHFLHHTFRKGLYSWFEKHNSYSSAEAQEAMKAVSRRAIDWAGLFSSDAPRRRAALKDLSFRLPCRSFLVYFYLMFIRAGVLDGPAGWMYCRMRADYEYLIALKVRELRRRQKDLPI